MKSFLPKKNHHLFLVEFELHITKYAGFPLTCKMTKSKNGFNEYRHGGNLKQNLNFT
jgi:hypothetical protein